MLKMFSVHDSKAEAFITPFYAPATGVAIRSFETAANTADHEFQKYAADYTLFELGSFDQETGIHLLLKAPLNLGNALTYQSAAREADLHSVG